MLIQILSLLPPHCCPPPPPPSVPSYLLTGDGDPLEAVLAHQILKGQLQLHLAFGRAAGIGRTVGDRDLLQCWKKHLDLVFGR